jgi:hypothetical protein
MDRVERRLNSTSTVPTRDLEWVCCLARGAGSRPSDYAKIGPSPPRRDSKMQRKRTGPGAPRAGPSPRKRGSVDVSQCGLEAPGRGSGLIHPRPDSKMQRKRTGPGRAARAPSGETRGILE